MLSSCHIHWWFLLSTWPWCTSWHTQKVSVNPLPSELLLSFIYLLSVNTTHQQQVLYPDITYSKSAHTCSMTYDAHHINYEPFYKAKSFIPPVFYLPSIHLLNQLGMISSQEWISSTLRISYLHISQLYIFNLNIWMPTLLRFWSPSILKCLLMTHPSQLLSSIPISTYSVILGWALNVVNKLRV